MEYFSELIMSVNRSLCLLGEMILVWNWYTSSFKFPFILMILSKHQSDCKQAFCSFVDDIHKDLLIWIS